MNDLNALPVAPEFITSLQEQATQTALECLRALNTPEHVIRLVQAIGEMGYYLEACYRDPDSLAGPPRTRFDIETVAIETVNAIARSGGSFQGPFTASLPREVRLSSRARKTVDRPA